MLPARSRDPKHTPDVDDYLTPEQETQLRIPAARIAWHWQEEHGCADPSCVRCRVGRALAVLSSAVVDGQAAADILCGLIPDLLEEAPAIDPHPDIDRFNEVCGLLIRALDTLEQTGGLIALAMRTPTTDPTRPDGEGGPPPNKGVN
jgi:hypothetical protein